MIHQKQEPTVDELIQEAEARVSLMEEKNTLSYLKRRLEEGKRKRELLQPPTNIDLTNPHKMKPDDRWNLYFYWLNLYRRALEDKLRTLDRDFRLAFKTFESLRSMADTNVMKEALVVGMTTTTAARLRPAIQALRSPVVIVEEAAEVLEAHIVTALTKHCKHLILIGDHQQLKPSTSDYQVETKFNLGISLFERMVMNNVQCYSLNVQHRMRPEISALIKPNIYEFLQDHPSVMQRAPIRGVESVLYFIDHQEKESDSDGTSKKNLHEAEFLISLARHLVLNGYAPDQITILAAYLGQMFQMMREKRKHGHILDGVRIAVLDNYQGEECDIILLSLVRNNNENKIGFLKIENRVCVALSRARDGFYIMGNMTQLCHDSELWNKIRKTLDGQGCLGPELSLRCQIHRDVVTNVKTASDFLPISEGGCTRKCDTLLQCGHKCTSLCHIIDREHKDYKCGEVCGK